MRAAAVRKGNDPAKHPEATVKTTVVRFAVVLALVCWSGSMIWSGEVGIASDDVLLYLRDRNQTSDHDADRNEHDCELDYRH